MENILPDIQTVATATKIRNVEARTTSCAAGGIQGDRRTAAKFQLVYILASRSIRVV